MFPKKTIRNLVTLLSTIVLAVFHTQGYADPVWTLRTTDGPSPRVYHGMVYDSCRDVVVLYGGSIEGALLADTWEWDGDTWTQRCGECDPGYHATHAMAFDEERCVTVLFGGDGPPGVHHNDTWEWDGSTWTQRCDSCPPPIRVWPSMTYDSTRGIALMFGGYESGHLNDLWKWDGTTWESVSTTSPSPSPRNGVGMAYDPVRDRTVLFGGGGIAGPVPCHPDGVSDETWELDMSQSPAEWTLISTSMQPTPRFLSSSLVYDAARTLMVLFGGEDGCTGVYGDTWEWNGSTWTEISTSGPNPRIMHGMAYDRLREEVVLFGGSLTTVYGGGSYPYELVGDTWTYGIAEDLDGDGVPDEEDDCPNSDLSPTIVIDGCDTEVVNQLFEDGCTMADLIGQCADAASNNAVFVCCVAHLTNDWKQDGVISGAGKGAIQSCAARAEIP